MSDHGSFSEATIKHLELCTDEEMRDYLVAGTQIVSTRPDQKVASASSAYLILFGDLERLRTTDDTHLFLTRVEQLRVDRALNRRLRPFIAGAVEKNDLKDAETRAAYIAVGAESLLAHRAGAEARLRRRIEHLEDTIFRLKSDTAILVEMFRGKQEEVDRLTEQLDAVQDLLHSQKRTDKLDKNTIASIANTVFLLVNSAVMVGGIANQPTEEVQQAAIEVRSECAINVEGVIESTVTLEPAEEELTKKAN